MRSSSLLVSTLAAGLMSAGAMAAQAAQTDPYNPANAASPTGYTIGHELFRTIGCPGRGLLETPCQVLDDDGDGVPNYMDKCPNTPAGQKVDEHGCPPAAAAAPAPAPAPVAAPAPKMPELVGANFDFDKSFVRNADFDNLDKSAATLKEWGNVKVEVAGHTDSIGTDEYNMGLSLRRARAVRDYLVSKGVAADRLIIKGYGESRPVADNGTREGRFQNRRVELVPQE